MLRICFILFMGFTGMLVSGTGIARAQDPVQLISKEELKAMLGAPDLVVIDVRGLKAGSGREPMITGAVREDPAAPEKWAGKYAKEKTLVIYCA